MDMNYPLPMQSSPNFILFGESILFTANLPLYLGSTFSPHRTPRRGELDATRLEALK